MSERFQRELAQQGERVKAEQEKERTRQTQRGVRQTYLFVMSIAR